MPPINLPSRKLAPHRRYAKKLLTLPDELLVKISNQVAPEDLPNFRLTCKTLANISAQHFGEKRLAHRRFMFTEHSLKGLIDMTAHPIIGPCIRSILFGTHNLTNELDVVMDTLGSHKVANPAEAMHILQMYRERRDRRLKFLESDDLSRLLQAAFSNLSSHGTNVFVGLFNEREEWGFRNKVWHGYSYSHEFGGLPFVKLVKMKHVLRIIVSACRAANLRPEFLEFDLLGQEHYDGMKMPSQKCYCGTVTVDYRQLLISASERRCGYSHLDKPQSPRA
ncbi:unnamed protein product [Aureobasidium vineae]|uniref:F-box domain-containing protein n=1 Tax=Aureobasidium vineae TaxID=2773715 RepID=A0A9N8JJ27_9PEZI|nr:unnamed protein product [Aureobasidium vineae]